MTCSNGCNGCGEPEPKVSIEWSKVLVSRDEFLKVVGLLSAAFIGLIVAIPGLGFAFEYFLVPRREDWIKVGPVESYQVGTTVDVVFTDTTGLPWDGVCAKRSAWLRRVDDQNFQAFAVNCTHLGCPVRWEPGAALFMCPCHGGVYYGDGKVAGGPPPRPLHQYATRIANGQVEIKVGPVLAEG
jgi:menaquinol-cytochrome c reductase iron-sulfur subunit